MHGNVSEWISDWWVANLPLFSQTDPEGPPFGENDISEEALGRMIHRECDQAGVRDASPSYRNDHVGFRLAFRPFSNSAPFDLFNSTGPLVIAENQPIGTIVGEFNATDPDGDPPDLPFSQRAGDGNNSLFTLDQNGVLKSDPYSITSRERIFSFVVARDEHNASAEGNFTVFLTDSLRILMETGLRITSIRTWMAMVSTL